MSTLKVDTVRPVTTDGSLSLKGDSGGSATTNGIVVDSSGDTSITGTLTGGTIGSGVVFPAGGTGNPISVAIICDQKTQNTNGGNFTLGDWRTRDLNTEISDPDGIVSISSNQFTLAAGTYLIEWSCPAYNVNRNQSRLYNVTGTASLAVGSSEYSVTVYPNTTRSTGGFIHTIAASNTYEIQHQCNASDATFGFGVANNFAVEIYTIVKISKLK